MQFDQYRKEVMVTWRNRGLTFEEQFVNAALGLAELGEFWWALEENATDEYGDMLYYITVLVNLFDVDLTTLPKAENDPFFQIRNVFELQGYAKKVQFHKKPLFDYLPEIHRTIKNLFVEFFNNMDEETQQAMQQNIDKLRKRHGSSFQFNTN